MTPNGPQHPVDLISGWLDDELDPRQSQLVESHLRACAACRTLVEDFKILRAAVAAEPAPAVPAELADRIAWRLRERAVRPRGAGAGRLRWSLPGILTAAGAVAAATVLGVVLLKEDVSQLGGPGSVGGIPPAQSAHESTSAPSASVGAETSETTPREETRSLARDAIGTPGANGDNGRMSTTDLLDKKVLRQDRDQRERTSTPLEDRQADRPATPSSASTSPGQVRPSTSATYSAGSPRESAPRSGITGRLESVPARPPSEPGFAPVPPARHAPPAQTTATPARPSSVSPVPQVPPYRDSQRSHLEAQERDRTKALARSTAPPVPGGGARRNQIAGALGGGAAHSADGTSLPESKDRSQAAGAASGVKASPPSASGANADANANATTSTSGGAGKPRARATETGGAVVKSRGLKEPQTAQSAEGRTQAKSQGSEGRASDQPARAALDDVASGVRDNAERAAEALTAPPAPPAAAAKQASDALAAASAPPAEASARPAPAAPAARPTPPGARQFFLPSCASLPVLSGSAGTWTVPASPFAWPAAAPLRAREAAAELGRRLAGTACAMPAAASPGETLIRIDVPREAWPRLGPTLRELGGPSLDETMGPPAGTTIVRILLRTPAPAPRR